MKVEYKHNTACLSVSGVIVRSCSRLVAADEQQQTEASDLFSVAAASLNV